MKKTISRHQKALSSSPLMKLTIITPTPQLTPQIRQNFATTGPSVRWLLVWTNETEAPPSNLNQRLKILRYPRKYLPIKDFSHLRNWSINQVKTPWLFFLDSDEIIDKKNWQKLKQLLKQQQPLVNGYLLKREDIFLGKSLKYGETGQIYLLRLAKTEFIRYQRVVHEIAGVSGMTERTNIVIRHFAHQSVAQFLAKVSRYAQLEANQRHTWKVILWWQLCFYPPMKFFFNYFFKLGFLDGGRGLVYATLMSFHSLLVRIYQLEK